MICPICGHEVKNGGHFCPACGTDLLPYTLEAETGGGYFLTDSDLIPPSYEAPIGPSEAEIPHTVMEELIHPDAVDQKPVEEVPPEDQAAMERKRRWINFLIAALAALVVIGLELTFVLHFAEKAAPASADTSPYTLTEPSYRLPAEE